MAIPSVRVVAFKNGFSFVTQRFSLERGSKSRVVRFLGVPTHGTVWFDMPAVPWYELEEMVKPLEGRRSSAGPFAKLLAANVGKDVTLTVKGQDEQQRIDGKLVKLLPTAESPEVAVVKRTPGGEASAVLVADVRAVSADDMMHPSEDPALQVRVKYDLREGKEDVVGAMHYLTNGLTWAPSYRLTLNREQDTSHLIGQAAVMCDLRGFSDDEATVEDISFAAGFPSFTMDHVPDAGLCSASIQEFFAACAGSSSPARPIHAPRELRQAMGRHHEWSASQQQHVPPQMVGGDDGDEPSDEGGRNEDLFLYKPLSAAGCQLALRMGSRHVVPFIQAASVECEDIYRVEVPCTMPHQPVSYSSLGSSAAAASEDGIVPVVHALRFRNTTRQPLTTAPILVMTSDDCVVAQGQTKYTLPGGRCVVDLTRAVECMARMQSRSSAEPKGKVIGGRTGFLSSSWASCCPSAARHGGHSVTVYQYSVDVSLRNTTDKPKKFVITTKIQGKLLRSEPEQSEIHVSTVPHGWNDQSTVTWEFTVPPKDSRKIVYTYETTS